MKYKAFLSYKHGKDDALAKSLEKSLEKFAKPTFKRRALEIFRDSNDLSAAADLGEKIRNGLAESEYFICMASPAYAKSKWCCREAEYWRDNKSIDNFLIVLTDGEILWDESTNDFDWSATTAIPKELSGTFSGEPFYIDFRNAGPEASLNLDNLEFKNRLVLLAATLHNKSIGDMVGEAVKQHKRTMRIRNAAITTLSILLFIAVASAIYAVGQKNKALLSNYIANSQAQFNEDPTKSLRLAEHAYKFAKSKNLPTENAAEQLIKVFYSGNGFYQEDMNIQVDFDEDNHSLYKNSAAFLKVKTLSDSIFQTIPDDAYLQEASALYFNETTNDAIYAVASQAMDFPRIYYLDYDNANYYIDYVEIKLDGFSGYTAHIESIAISKDGKYTLLGSANTKTALIDNALYKIHSNTNVFKDRVILKTSTNYPISAVRFIENDHYIATLGFDSQDVNGIRKDVNKTIYYYKTEPFPYIELINVDTEEGNISLDGKHFMVPADENSEPYAWFHFAHEIRDKDNNLVVEFPAAKGADLYTIKSPNEIYNLNYQGVFNAKNDLLIRFDLDRIDNSGIAYCFSENSEFIKISYLDGPERIFSLNPEYIINRINDQEIMGNIAQLTQEDKALFLVDN
ncbi:MAG: toll/interleukin-1 receptor domain-containing protein [Flavobacteriaceae bacterium]|nr:toll/interleukin-1 receptor domain-containing protein [Flavobacteriaceae bacterium]